MTNGEAPVCQYCNGLGVLGHWQVLMPGTIYESSSKLPDRTCDFCYGTGRRQTVDDQRARAEVLGPPSARQPLT